MRRPLSSILSRLPYKRPFMIGVAGVLLLGLVGAGVLWQIGAHASPARVSFAVTSDPGDPYSTIGGLTGASVVTWGHAGCGSIDANGICTSAVWSQYQGAYPGAHWIWATQQWNPSTQGGDPITFTKQFTIPQNAKDIQGTLAITADNHFKMQVNGVDLGWHGDNFTIAYTYDLASHLTPGVNTFTIQASNDPTPLDPSGNPAGLIFHADVSYAPDTTAPTTTATLAGTLGKNGWYTSPVTLTLAATDPDDNATDLQTSYSADGTTWNAYTAPVTFSTDGTYTVQFRSVDPATNREATQSQSFKIDQTPPDLHVSGALSATVNFCSGVLPTRPTSAPTDATSGVDTATQGDSWQAPSTATGAGTYTYEAHAADMAGNKTTETRTYLVAYGAAYGGVLDPISLTTSNAYTLSRTIPIKFQLLCNGTPITNAVAKLSVKSASGATSTATATATPQKLSTANVFVYQPDDQQYHLNVATSSGFTNPDGSAVMFTPGTWTFTISLDDGSSHAFTVQLS